MEEPLLYNIEQNKYSSRKIVLLKEIPDDKKELEEILNSKLFDLIIEKESKGQYCSIDGLTFTFDFDNKTCEIELEKYIEKCALEAMDEKN